MSKIWLTLLTLAVTTSAFADSGVCRRAVCHTEDHQLAVGAASVGTYTCANTTDMMTSCFVGFYPSGRGFCGSLISADPTTGVMSCNSGGCSPIDSSGFYVVTTTCCGLQVVACGS